MPYRRGFKSEAHALVAEIRADLGLTLLAPLDPWRLADHLEVPVITLSMLRVTAPEAVRCLMSREVDSFSAVTIFDGVRRLVVHNDAHVAGRQASNLTHELGHALLLHPPTAALDDRGCRQWDQEIEDEAGYLAGALLITPEAALHIVGRAVPLAQAASAYGVSLPMLQYRINVTGARLRVARRGRVSQTH